MPTFSGSVTKVKPIPPDVRPRPAWGNFFDQSSGFALDLPGRRSISIFVDRRFQRGNAKGRESYLAKPRIIAHCLVCSGLEWEIHSEPTDRRTYGVVIYTKKGKALAAGTARMVPERRFRFKIATLYKGMTNAGKIEYSAQGEATDDGGWKITVGVKYTK